MSIHILHLEDDAADAELIQTRLESAGMTCQITRVQTRAEFSDALLHDEYDIILADYNLPGYDGLSGFRWAHAHRPDIPFIFVSGMIGEDAAIESLTEGATDYVLKRKLARLVPAVQRALRDAENRRERRQAEEALRESESKFRDIARNIPGLVFQARVRPDGTSYFSYISPRAEEIFGLSSNPNDPAWSTNISQAKIFPEERRGFGAFVMRHLTERMGAGFEGRIGVSPSEVKYFQGIASPTRVGEELVFDGVLLDITERKRAEEALGYQLSHLRALNVIGQAIMENLDLKRTLDVFLEQTICQLHVDAADIVLIDPHTHTLEFGAANGFRGDAIRQIHQPVMEGYASQVAQARQIIHIADLKAGETQSSTPFGIAEDFVSYVGIPLIAKGQVRGVLEIFQRATLEPNPEWLSFLESLANQAAISIDNASLFYDLQRANIELEQAYETTLEGWSATLDLRDKETEGHTQRVTEMTVQLARVFGLSEKEIVNVRRGALLHDIGKMGIPDGILLKPDRLTAEEWSIMRMHPIYAYQLLYPIKYLHPALDIPYCHHEKWDGTGYPRGLKGEQIPLAARLFAVVDVWDALTSERPYRLAWTREKALSYILKDSEPHFDPRVVEAFVTFIATWQ